MNRRNFLQLIGLSAAALSAFIIPSPAIPAPKVGQPKAPVNLIDQDDVECATISRRCDEITDERGMVAAVAICKELDIVADLHGIREFTPGEIIKFYLEGVGRFNVYIVQNPEWIFGPKKLTRIHGRIYAHQH